MLGDEGSVNAFFVSWFNDVQAICLTLSNDLEIGNNPKMSKSQALIMGVLKYVDFNILKRPYQFWFV